jgi:hypothetical protein
LPTEEEPSRVVDLLDAAFDRLSPLSANWLVLTHTGAVTFEPVPLARAIAEELRLTRGPGGGLWYDAGGVYRSGGEDLASALVQRLLADDFRRNRLTEVLAWCKALPQTIESEANPTC